MSIVVDFPAPFGLDRDVDSPYGLDRPVGLGEIVQLDAGRAYAP